MSTKIYNGYTLQNMNLKELTAFTQQFRNKTKQVANEAAEKFLAKRIAHKLDQLCLLGEHEFIEKELKKYEGTIEEAKENYERFDPFFQEYYHAYQRYQEVQRTNHRDPEVDLDANAVFIPIGDKVLALFYGEQKEMKQLWEQEESVSYYGYWNNTDQDENCSEEEWEQRKIDWDEALPGYTLPLEAGLIAEFVKGYPSKSELSSDHILSYIPPAEVRAKDIARRFVWNEKSEQLQKEGVTRGYELAVASEKWVKTEQGQQRIKEVADDIQVKLFPVISKVHLQTSYQKLKEAL